MELYGLKSCDTCKKAEKALKAAGHDVTFVDIRQSPLAPEMRARFLAEFGEALVNRRSTTWRGLDEVARSDAPESLLAAHPALMKRPVIVAGDALYLGWDKTVIAALS